MLRVYSLIYKEKLENLFIIHVICTYQIIWQVMHWFRRSCIKSIRSMNFKAKKKLLSKVKTDLSRIIIIWRWLEFDFVCKIYKAIFCHHIIQTRYAWSSSFNMTIFFLAVDFGKFWHQDCSLCFKLKVNKSNSNRLLHVVFPKLEVSKTES